MKHFLLFTFLCLMPIVTYSQGNCLDFDGYNDRLFVPSAVTNYDDFTVEFWVYPHDNRAPNDLYVTSFGSNRSRFEIRTDGSGRLAIYQNSWHHTDTYMSRNTWYHIAVTRENNVCKIYVNGVLKNSFTPRFRLSSTMRMFLWNSYSRYHVRGKLDELRLWNIARTRDDINETMNCELSGSEDNLVGYWPFNQGHAGGDNAGLITPQDESGNGNDGTLYNFSLSGSSSNWILSNADIDNSCSCDEAPELINCPGVVSVNNDNDQCGASVEYEVSFLDNCDDGMVEHSINNGMTWLSGDGSGSFFEVGSTDVMVRNTNDNGGDTCMIEVIVTDVQIPVVLCQDITIELDDTGNASITSLNIDNGSYDACEIATYQLDQYDFSRLLGVEEVNLTVTDIYGNSNNCIAYVTITGDDVDCDNVHDAYDLCDGGDDTIDNDNDGQADCAYPPVYNDIIEDWKCGDNKVYLCHIPQGDPDNAQTICINKNAISSHIDNHGGDYLGQCYEADCIEELIINAQYHQSIDNENISPRNKERGQVGIQISPNPTSGHVVVKYDASFEVPTSFKIVNSQGRLIWSQEFKENEIQGHWKREFELSESQVYFFIASSKSGVKVKRIVVLDNGN